MSSVVAASTRSLISGLEGSRSPELQSDPQRTLPPLALVVPGGDLLDLLHPVLGLLAAVAPQLHPGQAATAPQVFPEVKADFNTLVGGPLLSWPTASASPHEEQMFDVHVVQLRTNYWLQQPVNWRVRTKTGIIII